MLSYITDAPRSGAHRRLAVFACLAAGCLHSAASAREQADDAIVVTGTRIADPVLAGTEPAVRVERETVLERNASHFADVLNETPGFRGSVTPEGAQPSYGQGVNFISAYGLGSNRTLTLVNGRRVVSSNGPTLFAGAAPGTQVDLNAIPSILVERVDRVAIGGAPVYGSDAIAGTVNVILRRRMQGLEMRALSGITERGDNFRWNIAAAGGIDLAGGRANLTGAVSIDRADGVASTARRFYRDNPGNAANPCTRPGTGTCSPFNLVPLLGPAGRTPANDGRVNPNIGFNDSASDGNPGSVLVRQFALAAITPGGVISNGPGAYAYRFAPDGRLVPYDAGTVFGAPIPGLLAPAATASGGDGLKLFDYVALTSRLQRTNAALSFTYEASDRLTLFADALYYHARSSEPVDLPSFNGVLFSGVSGALTFRTDNPFLTAQARQQLAGIGAGETFQLSRANTDLADLSGEAESKLYRIVAGVEGDFTLGGREASFEITANYGRSDFTDIRETIDQQKFVNAVNVASVDGRIVCSTAPTVTGFPVGMAPVADPACAPLNLFGTGAPSPEARAYIMRETKARSRLEQLVVNANLGMSPFHLFGNAASINVGLEHREERASFNPDAFLQAGLGRSVPIAPVSGSYDLDEAFGEVLLPLITPANRAVVSRLIAFGRVRRVESSTNGGFTAWSAGGAFAPMRDIEFHGNFTRSFRSPAILELFSPRTPVSTAVPDLCSAAQIGAGPAPDIRRANCTAFLARYPNATPLLAATATVPGLSGGNPDLRNEQADSFTFGAVLQPRFVPGLRLSADYLDIRIRNPIANLTVNQIAQGCFDNPAFDTADPANGNPFCSLIRRDGDGQVVSDAQAPAVSTGFVNGQRIEFSGVQVALDYTAELDRVGIKGAVRIGADVFHLRRRLIDLTGVAPSRSDGVVGDPRWQGQLRLRYANAAWGLRAHVNYTGKQIVARDNRGPAPNDTREFDHFDAFATVDTSVFVNAGEDVRLIFSVTNLFDRIGQNYFGYIVPLSIDDALGRRFAVSLEKRW